MDTKDISLVAIFASLYAVLVVVFAPVSFYALQFRFAGVLRPGIAKKRILALGYALGVLVGNMFSPFSNIYELAFMPFMSLVSGLAGYYIAKRFNNRYIVCGIVIAATIPISVSWMLFQLFNLPITTTLPGLLVSEQVVNLLGSAIFKAVEERVEWWN